MIVRPRVQPGPWLAERLQATLVLALAVVLVVILATGWGLT